MLGNTQRFERGVRADSTQKISFILRNSGYAQNLYLAFDLSGKA